MKKQNNPKLTNYYSAYKTRKTTHTRQQDVINSIPEHCWWLKQYLKGVYHPNRR